MTSVSIERRVWHPTSFASLYLWHQTYTSRCSPMGCWSIVDPRLATVDRTVPHLRLGYRFRRPRTTKLVVLGPRVVMVWDVRGDDTSFICVVLVEARCTFCGVLPCKWLSRPLAVGCGDLGFKCFFAFRFTEQNRYLRFWGGVIMYRSVATRCSGGGWVGR